MANFELGKTSDCEVALIETDLLVFPVPVGTPLPPLVFYQSKDLVGLSLLKLPPYIIILLAPSFASHLLTKLCHSCFSLCCHY